MNQELARVLRAPEVVAKYADIGLNVEYSNPQAVIALAKKQLPEMGQILKAAGVEPE